jgi:hypothetical protein
MTVSAPELWCWEADRAAHRLLYDTGSGVVRQVWTVPSDTKPFERHMAGVVNRTRRGAVAVFTPDAHSVVVQSAQISIDVSAEDVDVRARRGLLWVTLTLRSRTTGAVIRVRQPRASSALRDPMDGGFLETVMDMATQAENRGVALANWDPSAVPEGWDTDSA